MKRNSFCVLCAVFVCFSLTACGLDNYETVPEKTERVALKRPFAIFLRNVGVEIPGVMKPGKRNHGNGPCAAYDFDMSIQQSTLSLQVKTDDNINLPISISCGYRMIPGRMIDAALNYFPADVIQKDGARYIPSGGNVIEVTKVPISEIFNRNVLPYFDEASRDVIDSYRSKDITIEELNQKIMRKLVERLRKHKIPKIRYTEKGVEYPQIKYDENGTLQYAGPEICILDVMQISRVNIRDYSNPEFVQAEIRRIEQLKGEVVGKRAELKQWETKSQIRLNHAEHARQTALNMRKALQENPHMPKLQRLDNMRALLNNAKGDNNTRVFLVPHSMVNSMRVNLDDKS